ncbi:MAG: antitermination protein [Pantoea sp.]|uniref:bacteriophage antitermination protein Q n=1 Tax=Pantoea sp. TaxID=69393 RepID=UPI0011F41794|nr:bacteriophage antitermination protein Q [Pantoea sp.]RZK07195.1 MAG: antitermination protein [Pantoea sp.]
MRAQDLEYARTELRRALVDYSGKTKGQLEVLSENPPAEKSRLTRKPIHTVELNDGKGGKRKVRAENTAVYALETRSRRRPLPPISDEDFAASPWRRAVNQLSEHEQSWLRYCYGYDLDFRHQITLCEHVWREFQQCLPPGLIRKTQKRLSSLVWVAVQEIACSQSNSAFKKYAGALLASRLGVSRSTWSRIYAPHWKVLKTRVKRLDERAVNGALEKYIILLNE